MAEKKRQHTVPRFYLAGFSAAEGDRVLWEYSKSDPARPSRMSPRNATVQDYFYSQPLANGTWDHTTEAGLEHVESDSARAVSRLLNTKQLSGDDRSTLSFFIGLMIKRTIGPSVAAEAHRPILESPGYAEKYIRENFERLSRRFGEATLLAFLGQVLERGAGLSLAHNFHIIDLLERGDEFGSRIFMMRWTIESAKPPAAFITSDNPAFARIPRSPLLPPIVGIDRADLNVELGFPLTRQHFLICHHRGNDRLSWATAKPTRVRELNRRTVLSAHEHVYSSAKDSVIQQLVEEHRSFRVQYPPYTDR